MEKRIKIYAVMLCALFLVLAVRLYLIINDEEIIKASVARRNYTVSVKLSDAFIYDRNMKPLTNTEKKYCAVINPDIIDPEEIYPYLSDKTDFLAKAGEEKPFVCEVKSDNVRNADIPVFKCTEHFSDGQTAEHIIGYTFDGGGSGVEGLYSDFLKSHETSACVSYRINAVGNVLNGADISIDIGEHSSGGVVLSIDKNIQKICEDAMSKTEKGACIVMDVKTGDILASVSRPSFDIKCPEKYLDDKDAPFVNRVFSPYNVGSVFKTVIAAAALEYGISEDFTMKCTGKMNVGTQEFNCHYWPGHGNLKMRRAMSESCNPYFITLGSNIPVSYLCDFMRKCGFGADMSLDGLFCDGGYLPDENELAVKAEKANLSFGQGKLLCSPLQICRFVCAVANGGQMPKPRLIYGTVEKADEIISPAVSHTEIMKKETADKLKSFMFDTLYKANSAAVLIETDGGGKTSTAQTGKFNEDGSEILTCWFAGFFPYENPEYAAVITVENGVTGNLTCGPIFKEIAENIM